MSLVCLFSAKNLIKRNRKFNNGLNYEKRLRTVEYGTFRVFKKNCNELMKIETQEPKKKVVDQKGERNMTISLVK